ncbi:DUF6597 domain-containing transcriptional factor [Marispirochaeta aestuarii]|uniref:DUF6597 domain-containing transcriptional factor n=1 Tax=Marispirochaeta aestuarii TaxID=1963862 RepID=UPI0029C80ED1|nr:DUF6597 domain-containing transcriptional factor [Marispirochaeta aestuarii]
MKYRIIPPCNELKGVISHFWEATWDAKSRAPNMVYYIIANTLTNITFAFDSDNKHSELLFSAIEGHTHLPQQLPVAGFYHLTGVSVHSYALPLLFKTPSSDLSNEFLSLGTFLGHEGSIINEKTALANSIDQRIEILSKYFIALLKDRGKEDRLMTNAIKEIRKYNGYIDMAADPFFTILFFFIKVPLQNAEQICITKRIIENEERTDHEKLEKTKRHAYISKFNSGVLPFYCTKCIFPKQRHCHPRRQSFG